MGAFLALLWHMPGRTWRGALRAAPLRVWAMFLAAPVLTLAAVGQTFIVWRGPWPETLARQQLEIIGWAHLIVLALIGVIVAALAAVKVKAAGPGGLSLELENDDDTAAPAATTAPTPTTEMQP